MIVGHDQDFAGVLSDDDARAASEKLLSGSALACPEIIRGARRVAVDRHNGRHYAVDHSRHVNRRHRGSLTLVDRSGFCEFDCLCRRQLTLLMLVGFVDLRRVVRTLDRRFLLHILSDPVVSRSGDHTHQNGKHNESECPHEERTLLRSLLLLTLPRTLIEATDVRILRDGRLGHLRILRLRDGPRFGLRLGIHRRGVIVLRRSRRLRFTCGILIIYTVFITHIRKPLFSHTSLGIPHPILKGYYTSMSKLCCQIVFFVKMIAQNREINSGPLPA